MVVSLGLVHIAKVTRYIRYSMNEFVSKSGDYIIAPLAQLFRSIRANNFLTQISHV